MTELDSMNLNKSIENMVKKQEEDHTPPPIKKKEEFKRHTAKDTLAMIRETAIKI